MIDIICHLASFLEAIAFFQTNMEYLRILEVIANGLMLIHAWDKTGRFYDCKFVWSLFHMIINLARIGTFLYCQYVMRPTQEEKVLLKRGSIFDIFTTAQFSAMKSGFTWKTFGHEEIMLHFGDKVKTLMLVTNGAFGVYNKEKHKVTTVDTCVTGPTFVGELSYYTGAPATATVQVASEKLRAILFDMETLRDHNNKDHHTLKAQALRQLPSLFARRMAQDFAKERRSQDGKHDEKWNKLRKLTKGIGLHKRNTRDVSPVKRVGRALMLINSVLSKKGTRRKSMLQIQSIAEEAVFSGLVTDDRVPGVSHKPKKRQSWFGKDITLDYIKSKTDAHATSDHKIYPSSKARGEESKKEPLDDDFGEEHLEKPISPSNSSKNTQTGIELSAPMPRVMSAPELLSMARKKMISTKGKKYQTPAISEGGASAAVPHLEDVYRGPPTIAGGNQFMNVMSEEDSSLIPRAEQVCIHAVEHVGSRPPSRGPSKPPSRGPPSQKVKPLGQHAWG